MVIAAALVSADLAIPTLHWLAVIASLAFAGLIFWCGIRDVLDYHHASPASIAVWFICAGFFARSEMESRAWKIQAGNWMLSIGFGLVTVTVFAGFFYPKIKPSWGGGAPISATLYFAKDSPILPGQSVSARILEETDSGFYLIGGSNKSATFIPRSEVAMVYYSNDPAGSFITKQK